MRAGHAARDDRLALNQRPGGAGEFVLTPEEERCVEFLDAMEEALSVAENRWVCGIVEAGERDWRAWAWRADRRTRLPHGYRACGEWDVGANESTLSGIRERQAARVEWQRKMQAAAAAAEDAESSEVIAEARKDGNAEGSEIIAKARKSESAEGFEGQEDQGTKGPKADEKVAVAQKNAAGVVSKVITTGGLMASVVLLLGLWLSPFDAGRGGGPTEHTEHTEMRANESGFQPWGFGRQHSWAVGPSFNEAAPLALAETLTRSATGMADGEVGARWAKASRLPLQRGRIARGMRAPRLHLIQGGV
jgi:hypothetical protein